jgi:uncharacterized membrane protein YvbJ
MQCRNCGTDIADKAIVCYRCGHATTDPVRKAAPIKKKTNPLLSFVLVVILILLALYMGYASQTAQNPEQWQTIAGVFAGAALLVLVLRLLRRR